MRRASRYAVSSVPAQEMPYLREYGLCMLIAVACVSMLGGCGSGAVPSEAQARQAAEGYLREFGDILDFQKTNGEPAEVFGSKLYIVHFRAATRLPDGYYWVKPGLRFPGQLDHSVEKRVSGRPSFNDAEVKPIPRGATDIVQGKVVFRATEKGWVFDRQQIVRLGYCEGVGAAACYQARGL